VLRTLAEFMRIGFSLNPNLERFERTSGAPIPPAPRLAIDDERWLIDRDAEWEHLGAVQRLDLRDAPRLVADPRPFRELVAR
jgi:hypothetical protein